MKAEKKLIRNVGILRDNGITQECGNRTAGPQHEGGRRTVALLLFAGYVFAAIGFASVLVVGQHVFLVVVILSSLIAIRVLRVLIIPPSRGVLISWTASSVFVGASLTLLATYLPSAQNRVFELISSFTVDVVAKWLMMIVIGKSKYAWGSKPCSSWQMALNVHEQAILSLLVDGGTDIYISSLFTSLHLLRQFFFCFYITRMLLNILLIMAALKEIAKLDKQAHRTA